MKTWIEQHKNQEIQSWFCCYFLCRRLSRITADYFMLWKRYSKKLERKDPTTSPVYSFRFANPVFSYYISWNALFSRSRFAYIAITVGTQECRPWSIDLFRRERIGPNSLYLIQQNSMMRRDDRRNRFWHRNWTKIRRTITLLQSH
jgi:hypothetical protein